MRLRHFLSLSLLGLCQVAAANTAVEMPKTWQEEGLQIGFPAAAEKQVNQGNWLFPPYNRWSLQNLEAVLPSVTLYSGSGVPSAMPEKNLALDNYSWTDRSEKSHKLLNFLEQSYVDAAIVVHKGNIAYEKYFNGQDASTRHQMFSVTKSFTGLIGEKMLAEGKLKADKRVDAYLPQIKGSAFADATVRQLLDMEVAVKYVEDYEDPYSDVFRYMYASNALPVPEGLDVVNSLYQFLPTLEKRAEHGKAFHYITAVSDVLSWLIEEVDGRPFHTIVEQDLWQKVSPERDGFFVVDAAGKALGGGGLNTTARDMARLAMVMSSKGRVNGEQIIPKAAIESIYKGGNPETWQASLDPSYPAWMPSGTYRSQWYNTHNEHGAIMALGIYGQYVYIDPTNELVVVIQSSIPSASVEAFDTAHTSLFMSLSEYFGKR